MLSSHAHTETFPVRIAPVPVFSYATRVIHVVLWMCFPPWRANALPTWKTPLYSSSHSGPDGDKQAVLADPSPSSGTPPFFAREVGRWLHSSTQSQRVAGVYVTLRSNSWARTSLR